MSAETDRVITQWRDGQTVDMLVEMRKGATNPDAHIVRRRFHARYGSFVETNPQIAQIHIARFVDCGRLCRVHTGGRSKQSMTISIALFVSGGTIHKMGSADDLLGRLIAHPAATDDLIRDQLLTMMIAGHDTSTALHGMDLGHAGHAPRHADAGSN